MMEWNLVNVNEDAEKLVDSARFPCPCFPCQEKNGRASHPLSLVYRLVNTSLMEHPR
jgi:hypothetical protein